MNTEDLLTKEIAKIGAIGGFVGGGFAGAIGGATGSFSAAKKLSTEVIEKEIRLSLTPEETLRKALQVVSKLGRVQPVEFKSKVPIISGLIGSGFMNMNPCVINVELIGAEAEQTLVRISGAAKEGLIKQNTAAKAVNKVTLGLTKF